MTIADTTLDRYALLQALNVKGGVGRIKGVLENSGEILSAEEVVKHIQGGLQSSMSYSNARNLNDFSRKCQFGYRR